jgi:hypothetical protein
MRRLMLMTLFMGAVAAPAMAQSTPRGEPQPALAKVLFGQPVRLEAAASPDALVARLMSFDRNHDGLVSRDELPERMQPILTRIEVFTTNDALDETEIRRLAENPIAKPQAFVLQAGHYGFGDDNGFDTQLRIESAIEDLRLAGDTRQKAIDIGHRFVEELSAQAKASLLEGLTPLLSEEQLGRVSASFDRKPDLHLLIRDAGPERLHAAEAQLTQMLKLQQVAILVAAFQLGNEQATRASEIIAQFQRQGGLTDVARTALVQQMDGLLSDEERVDLRAALERRPVVKQGLASQ